MFITAKLVKSTNSTLVKELVEIVNQDTTVGVTEKLHQLLSQLDNLGASFKEILITTISDSLKTEITLTEEDESLFAASSSGSERGNATNQKIIRTNLLTAFLAINDRAVNSFLAKYELISDDSILENVEEGLSALEYLLNHDLEEQVSRLVEHHDLGHIVDLIKAYTNENPLLNYYKHLIEINIDEQTYLQSITSKLEQAIEKNDLDMLNNGFAEINNLPKGIQKRVLFEEQIKPSIATCFRNAIEHKDLDIAFIEAFYQRGLHLAMANDSNETKPISQLINSKRDIKTKCEILKREPKFIEHSFCQLSIHERVHVLNLLARAKESTFFKACWEENHKLLSTQDDHKRFKIAFNKVLLPYAAQFEGHTLNLIHYYLTTTTQQTQKANQIIGTEILEGKNEQNLDALNWLIDSNVIEQININHLDIERVFSKKSTTFYQRLINLDLFNMSLADAYIPLIMEKQFDLASVLIERNVELPDRFWRRAGMNFNLPAHMCYPAGYKVLIPGLIKVTSSPTSSFDKFLKGRVPELSNDLSIMRDFISSLINYHPEKITTLLLNKRYYKAFQLLDKEEKQQLVNKLNDINPELVPLEPSIQELIGEAEVINLPIDYLSHYLFFNSWEHEQKINDKLVEQFGAATYHNANYDPFNFDIRDNINSTNYRRFLGLPNYTKNLLCLMSQDNTFKQIVKSELEQGGNAHLNQLRAMILTCAINDLASTAEHLHQIAPNVDFATELFHRHLRSHDNASLDNLLSKFKTLNWKINLTRLCERTLNPEEYLNLVYLLVDSKIEYTSLSNVRLQQETRDYILNQWITPLINSEYNQKETLKIQIRAVLKLLPHIEGRIGINELNELLGEPTNLYLSNQNIEDEFYPAGSLAAMCLNVIKHNEDKTREATEKLPPLLHEGSKSFFDNHCNYFDTDPVMINVTEASMAASSSAKQSTTNSETLRFFTASESKGEVILETAKGINP